MRALCAANGTLASESSKKKPRSFYAAGLLFISMR
nr:MAG TPA: hypothetical protein [Caudoviricetes sp.]